MIVKVDFRQQKAAQQAKAASRKFWFMYVFDTFIPLLSAFDKAEAIGSAVLDAVDDLGRSDPRG